jgi:hypothetical protein
MAAATAISRVPYLPRTVPNPTSPHIFARKPTQLNSDARYWPGKESVNGADGSLCDQIRPEGFTVMMRQQY